MKSIKNILNVKNYHSKLGKIMNTSCKVVNISPINTKNVLHYTLTLTLNIKCVRYVGKRKISIA